MAIFKKLNIGDTVATSGTRAVKKLTTELPIWNGTDLTGTTWYIPAGWTAEAGYGVFVVSGTYRYTDWDSFIYTPFDGLHIGYTAKNASSPFEELDNSIGLSYVGNAGLSSSVGKDLLFIFDGGTDATNPRLIDWLLKNGELTSHQPAHKGGLYDADDNLVASWNALVYTYGMDAEKVYTEYDYSYDPASPSSVLSGFNSGTKLIIPDSVTSIGIGAFLYCTNLSSVTIGNSVQTVEINAFCGCSALTSVVIPISVTTIGMWAFARCANLKDVYYRGTAEQWAAITIESNGYLKAATIHYNSP